MADDPGAFRQRIHELRVLRRSITDARAIEVLSEEIAKLEAKARQAELQLQKPGRDPQE